MKPITFLYNFIASLLIVPILAIVSLTVGLGMGIGFFLWWLKRYGIRNRCCCGAK